SLDAIRGCARLKNLVLDYTDVGDAGLAQLSELTALERLSLDSTHVTDASTETLCRFSRLRELNLYHTFFTPRGHEQVREALPDCKIVWDPLSSDSKRRRS
ncbi:MAG: hypothetical protein AB7F89_04660, partial [Pirellulaceae bacterium]